MCLGLLLNLRILLGPRIFLSLVLRGNRRSGAAATAQDMPDDERDDRDDHRDQHVQRVLGDVVVDRVDVIAGQVAEAHPGPDPQSRAECVEAQETPPVHAGDAGDDSVRLAQALDEPRDHDDLAAVPLEEALGLGQPLLGQPHVAPPSQRQRTAAEMPDGEPDVVPDDGRGEADDPDGYDVELLMAGVDGGRDQDGVAGDGYAEVLKGNQGQDRPVPVVIERPGQGIEKAWHRRWPGEVRHGQLSAAVSASATGPAVSSICQGRAPYPASTSATLPASLGFGGSQLSLRNVSGASRFSAGSLLASAMAVRVARPAASRAAAAGSRSAQRCAGGGPLGIGPLLASGRSPSALVRAFVTAASHSFSCRRAWRPTKPLIRFSCGPLVGSDRAASMIALSGRTRRGDRSAAWAIRSLTIQSSRTTASPRRDWTRWMPEVRRHGSARAAAGLAASAAANSWRAHSVLPCSASSAASASRSSISTSTSSAA